MWKLKGYTVDAFDQTQVVYNIWANTKNDLPSTMTDIGYGTALGFGSTAQTFDDSKEWRWNGTEWVEQTDGQEIEIGADNIIYDNTDSGLTATNVQDAIDEIKDLDDRQDRALAELYGEDANQQLEINYAINTGSKNLFPITATSQTLGGITFTFNSDGTITANGTKTNNDWFVLSENNVLDPGTYTLSDGLPDDTTDCRLIIGPSRSLGAAIMSTTTGIRTQTKTFADAQTGLYYAIRIASGKTVNNLTFKPMIRRAEITDSTFVPYAPTNRELYETKTEQTETNVIANLGAKNLFKNTAVSKTYLGVTFTVNDDGTVSLSGTATTAVSVLEIGTVTPPAGSYIISGCPVGGSWSPNPNKYRIRVAKNGSWAGDETGNGFTVTVNGSDIISLQINSGVGVDTAGLVFKPMIRKAEITDGTFQPYAPTNRELYEMILALQNGRSVQSLNSPMKLNLDRNDLNESLDTNFDLIDSIPEEEEGEEDV